MAMDEEVIQRIIYIIIGIIIFISYFFKKKEPKKQTTSTNSQTVTENKQAKQDFPPIETLDKRIDNTNKPKNTTNQLEVIIEEEFQSEEIVKEEIYEDETILDRKTIKKNIKKTIKEEQKDESFTFTNEELRKAVILSEIIQPKYF